MTGVRWRPREREGEVSLLLYLILLLFIYAEGPKVYFFSVSNSNHPPLSLFVYNKKLSFFSLLFLSLHCLSLCLFVVWGAASLLLLSLSPPLLPLTCHSAVAQSKPTTRGENLLRRQARSSDPRQRCGKHGGHYSSSR